MTYVPAWLRRLVEERANRSCEYCRAQKRIILVMEVDHVIPQTLGGKTEIHNLCLACRNCNAFKAAFTTGLDPRTNQEATLYNPRLQIWGDHFAWTRNDTVITGRTAVGRATITRLRMNRTDAVEARKLWRLAGLHPPPGPPQAS